MADIVRAPEFGDLLGKTLTRIEQLGNDRVEIDTADGGRFALFHYQDCCESVAIEDVLGNFADVIGAPLTMAAEIVSSERPTDLKPLDYDPESVTWSIYQLATAKGFATIRWEGSSNGYYSESVYFGAQDEK